MRYLGVVLLHLVSVVNGRFPGGTIQKSVIDRIAVQQALWLLIRPFEDLKVEERKNLQEL